MIPVILHSILISKSLIAGMSSHQSLIRYRGAVGDTARDSFLLLSEHNILRNQDANALTLYTQCVHRGSHVPWKHSTLGPVSIDDGSQIACTVFGD